MIRPESAKLAHFLSILLTPLKCTLLGRNENMICKLYNILYHITTLKSLLRFYNMGSGIYPKRLNFLVILERNL